MATDHYFKILKSYIKEYEMKKVLVKRGNQNTPSSSAFSTHKLWQIPASHIGKKPYLHQTPTSFFIVGTMMTRTNSTKWLSSSEFSTTALTAFWHLSAMKIHTNFKTSYSRITENVANAIHYFHHIWRKTLGCLSKLLEYSSKQLFFINLSDHKVIGHAHSPKKNTEILYVYVISK